MRAAGGHASIRYAVCAPVDDATLSGLHAAAFGQADHAVTPWQQRLSRWSLTWVTAYDADRLVGFVNVLGDGGAHAVLLDTVTVPESQGVGIGRRLVAIAATEARRSGAQWLHVDYEPALADFYERVCGFDDTRAGLLRLAD